MTLPLPHPEQNPPGPTLPPVTVPTPLPQSPSQKVDEAKLLPLWEPPWARPLVLLPQNQPQKQKIRILLNFVVVNPNFKEDRWGSYKTHCSPMRKVVRDFKTTTPPLPPYPLWHGLQCLPILPHQRDVKRAVRPVSGPKTTHGGAGHSPGALGGSGDPPSRRGHRLGNCRESKATNICATSPP